MAIHDTAAEQARACIEEYLETARICLKPSDRNDLADSPFAGRMMGYPAALLLLSVVDAIGGYRRQKDNKESHGTDLTPLMEWPFNTSTQLTAEDVKDITHWFRNGLAHTGGLPGGVSLHATSGMFVDWSQQPDQSGRKQVVALAVTELYRLVVVLWRSIDSDFGPQSLRGKGGPDTPRCPPAHLIDASGITGTQDLAGLDHSDDEI